MIAIIIPTYNEAKNIRKTLERAFKALSGYEGFEIIVVDDNSPDGTAAIARSNGKRFNARVIVRTEERGLSSAVMHGFSSTEADILAVMDADISHPPETLPKLIDEIKDGMDIAIGSRIISGGGVEEWPFIRRLMSVVGRILAFPITDVRDTMSGFFAIRRKVIRGVKLKPRGYKILLEILARGCYRKTRVKEIAYTFTDREGGESKIGLKEIFEYMVQVLELYLFKLKKLLKV